MYINQKKWTELVNIRKLFKIKKHEIEIKNILELKWLNFEWNEIYRYSVTESRLAAKKSRRRKMKTK